MKYGRAEIQPIVLGAEIDPGGADLVPWRSAEKHHWHYQSRSAKVCRSASRLSAEALSAPAVAVKMQGRIARAANLGT